MIYSRNNIALLCTSAIYFYAWVAIILAGLTQLTEPVLYGIYMAFILLYPLSVFGSLSFVFLNHKKSNKWFLGLPLLIVFLEFLLLPYASLESLLVFLLAFIAPASALFIKSLPKEHGKSAKKYVMVATVVSIYMVIIAFIYFINIFLLRDNSLDFFIFVMGMIYLAFGLPLIGICLLLIAKKGQPSASVPKHAIKPAL